MGETPVIIGELSPDLRELAEHSQALQEAIDRRVAAGASLACEYLCSGYPGRVTSIKPGDVLSCEPEAIEPAGRDGLPYLRGRCAIVTSGGIIEGA